MRIIWKPFWYELDQTIVIGDIDYFYIEKDRRHFSNGLLSDDDYEITAKIISITHKVLGEVIGIVTIGLDYSIFMKSGEILRVNAEESPGEISDSKYTIDDWTFEVEIEPIEESGITSKQRISMLNRNEMNALNKKRIANYNRLLDTEIIIL